MTTYNITQSDAGHWEEQFPDTVDVAKLVPGDYIAKYVEVDIVLDYDDTVPTEMVLMLYVASVQPNKKFKVYRGWGDCTTIYEVRWGGAKVRNEDFAKAVFPLLADWEFVV